MEAFQACVMATVILTLASAAEVTEQEIASADTKFNLLIQEKERRLAGFLQMAFHDCIGGCDGCIDVTAPDNIGLVEVYGLAQQFRRDHFPRLSLADVIAFLAARSLKVTIERANGTAAIPVRKGRVDCPPGDLPVRAIPQGSDPRGLSFLMNEFGLTTRQAVALLGCHSVGRTRPENSGYHGVWDATEFTMDNGYYRNMIASGWLLERVSNNRINATQFSKGDFMMLMVDMALFKTLSVGGDFFKTPSCNYTTCRANPITSPIVNEYARNMAAFHKDMVTAFVKMIENTPHPLDDLENVGSGGYEAARDLPYYK